MAAAVVAALGGTVQAADPDALIKQGVELRRKGDDEGALRLFEQAYALRKSPLAAAQVGFAEQALGSWGQADQRLREALASPGDPWISKHRGAIEESLKTISRHIGHIEISGSPAGAEVRVDGELVGRLPLDRVISATGGNVAVEVRASGFLPILRATSVSPGQLTRERFQLQPLAPQGAVAAEPERAPATASRAPAAGAVAARKPADEGATAAPAGQPPAMTQTTSVPQTDQAGEGRGSHRALALGAAGLAAATLAVAIVEHLSWQNKAHTFNDNAACDNLLPQKGGSGCQGLYDAGQRARTIAFVGYGVTAGLVATATVLFLTDPGRRGEPQSVACAPLGATAGLGCWFRF